MGNKDCTILRHGPKPVSSRPSPARLIAPRPVRMRKPPSRVRGENESAPGKPPAVQNRKGGRNCTLRLGGASTGRNSTVNQEVTSLFTLCHCSRAKAVILSSVRRASPYCKTWRKRSTRPVPTRGIFPINHKKKIIKTQTIICFKSMVSKRAKGEVLEKALGFLLRLLCPPLAGAEFEKPFPPASPNVHTVPSFSPHFFFYQSYMGFLTILEQAAPGKIEIITL